MFKGDSKNYKCTINTVEKKWLNILSRQNKELFKDSWLPSHDHDHHSRVWKIAKKLLHYLHGTVYEYDEAFVKKLMFAVFFHDTGMVHTLEKEHGRESRYLCSKFISDNDIHFAKKDENDLFNAIERHDDKEYKSSLEKNSFSLYHILTIADDLDALGAIGVFRYFEIYHHRGMSTAVFSREAKSNLTGRFNHFNQVFADHPELVIKFKPGYSYAKNFFEACINKSESHMQVLTILKKSIIVQKKTLNEVALDNAGSADKIIAGYFKRVLEESAKTSNTYQ